VIEAAVGKYGKRYTHNAIQPGAFLAKESPEQPSKLSLAEKYFRIDGYTEARDRTLFKAFS
jgi:hypothetical protein